MTVALEDRVVPSPRVLYKEVAGEAVLLDLETETYFGLNAAGARCWELLTTAPSVRDALEVLTEEYDVAPDELRRDLDTLIDELLDRGLLRVAHG
jgi:hypothetical protein